MNQYPWEFNIHSLHMYNNTMSTSGAWNSSYISMLKARSSHRGGRCCHKLRTVNRTKTVCRTVEHMNFFFNHLALLALWNTHSVIWKMNQSRQICLHLYDSLRFQYHFVIHFNSRNSKTTAVLIGCFFIEQSSYTGSMRWVANKWRKSQNLFIHRSGRCTAHAVHLCNLQSWLPR